MTWNEGTVGQAAYRLEELDYLFEGDVLMLLRGKAWVLAAASSSATVGEPDRSRRSSQGVDEEADQVFDLGPSAVGHGRCR